MHRPKAIIGIGRIPELYLSSHFFVSNGHLLLLLFTCLDDDEFIGTGHSVIDSVLLFETLCLFLAHFGMEQTLCMQKPSVVRL